MELYKGNIVDIEGKEIYYGQVSVEDRKIISIERLPLKDHEEPVPFIMPGFIDAHVHIESSLLIPSEFARMAVVHGTVGTISDPHEIANVCGIDGVNFMLQNGRQVPFKFHFGAPSCVPATIFETAGDALSPEDVDTLLQNPDIYYLSEMMNFPGVLHNDPEVLAKLASAKKYNKPIDGHAPGLRGEDARTYIAAGITTDHECFTEAEAAEKLGYGMKILIREGSAAKNFEALSPLLHDHSDMMMFCSDDKHPDSLEAGHINDLCRRAVTMGVDVFKVLQVACINPVIHYKMNVGILKEQHPADFIMVKDLQSFEVLSTYINGQKVAENGKTLIDGVPCEPINRFNCKPALPADFRIEAKEAREVNVIGAIDGQLITEKIKATLHPIDGNLTSDISNDILKMVVINRYNPAPVAKAFIKNFGLKKGALASSVAHDSHNIVVIGVSDEDICKAANLVIKHQGGLAAVGDQENVLPLPVAGLMSNGDGYAISTAYTELDNFVKAELGSTLSAPFMTLSFMALLVIPHLKLSDKGLFDGDSFSFIEI